MALAEFTSQLNEWGRTSTPFLFVVDFELKKPLATALDTIDPARILYDVNGISNATAGPFSVNRAGVEIIHRAPIPASLYEEKFRRVFAHLAYGDSFLTNLTIDTEIQLSHALRDIFSFSQKSKSAQAYLRLIEELGL